MNRVICWVRHVRTSAQIEPRRDDPGSTLESFFAGVRWSEEPLPDGRTALRPASM